MKRVAAVAVAVVAAMMPHQVEGVRFLEAAGGRAMLADDPGLGKTRTAIEFLKTRARGITVVTTKSFLYGWREELEKWWPECRTFIVDKASLVAKVPEGVDVVVTSYDVLWRTGDGYAWPGDSVVFDESHKLANHETKRSTAARQLVLGKRHVICLTGTPQPAGQPRQLWHQMLLVFPRFLTWRAFAARFCDPKQVWASWAGRGGRYVWDYSGASNVEELQALIAPRMLRRTKEVLGLPALSSQDVPCPVRTPRKRGEEWVAYAARLAEAKVPAALSLVSDCLERGSKVIVFSSFRAVRDQVFAAFTNVARVTAEMEADQRANTVRWFQTDGQCRVFTATTQIAGEALTLTAADVVIFVDRPWTPGALEQALSRAHRTGQTKPVVVYHVMSDTVFDTTVREVLSTRQRVTEQVLEGKLGRKK